MPWGVDGEHGGEQRGLFGHGGIAMFVRVAGQRVGLLQGGFAEGCYGGLVAACDGSLEGGQSVQERDVLEHVAGSRGSVLTWRVGIACSKGASDFVGTLVVVVAYSNGEFVVSSTSPRWHQSTQDQRAAIADAHVAEWYFASGRGPQVCGACDLEQVCRTWHGVYDQGEVSCHDGCWWKRCELVDRGVLSLFAHVWKNGGVGAAGQWLQSSCCGWRQGYQDHFDVFTCGCLDPFECFACDDLIASRQHDEFPDAVRFGAAHGRDSVLDGTWEIVGSSGVKASCSFDQQGCCAVGEHGYQHAAPFARDDQGAAVAGSQCFEQCTSDVLSATEGGAITGI